MEPDGPQIEYSDDGIDLTLIRAMLAMTPAERLAFHEQHINAIFEIWDYAGIQPAWLSAAAGASR